MIDKLFSSGLLEFLQQELVPSCIIIFGGVRKGEYDADSDIDLFVETTKEKKVDLSVFEKKLNHPIHLFVANKLSALHSKLVSNILNGIKLSGYVKVQ